MYDIIYDFIKNSLLNATASGGNYPPFYEDMALMMTHTTLWLMYVCLILLTIHLFNAFRSMTRFW